MDLSAVDWRKSSRSAGGADNCVEVAALPRATVAIRDSKAPGGPAHVITAATYRTLIDRIKRRELDL